MELARAQRRLKGQQEILLQSKAALDAAVAAKMVSLVESCAARIKRQSDAAARTQAQIVELESAIREADNAAQMDLVNAQEHDRLEEADRKRGRR